WHHLASVLFFALTRLAPLFSLFPYTTLFRSCASAPRSAYSSAVSSVTMLELSCLREFTSSLTASAPAAPPSAPGTPPARLAPPRSEEHTSELQSRFDLVCRLLLEKKKKYKTS